MNHQGYHYTTVYYATKSRNIAARPTLSSPPSFSNIDIQRIETPRYYKNSRVGGTVVNTPCSFCRRMVPATVNRFINNPEGSLE